MSADSFFSVNRQKGGAAKLNCSRFPQHLYISRTKTRNFTKLPILLDVDINRSLFGLSVYRPTDVAARLLLALLQ